MEEKKPDFIIPEAKLKALEEVHQEHLIRVNHRNPEPPVRGEKLLRALDLAFLKLNHWVEKIIPDQLNPLAQTGAVANTAFFICILSGILLLLWFDVSVHTAHSSLEAMKDSFWTAQLMRSLHRYSSDVCMLFVLIHALQIFVGRRFGGPRWVAWITGGLLVAFLWLDGWSGYWLVWDEKAKHIALGTAKMLDVLPIFADPFSQSFLIDQSINTLLFFLVFFLHMLVPMGMGVVLWIHIARLNRPKFLTGKELSLAILISLIALSIIFPAYSAAPAKMQVITQKLPLDYFFMLPLWFTDRLEGGFLWLIFFLASVIFFTLPWWMVKRHAEPAFVLDKRCNGCGNCYQDCPYNAITLMSLQGQKWDHVAQIDPNKCVGCGICVGSCNPGAIIFPKLPVEDARERINLWLENILKDEDRPYIAFLCANSAGSDLEVSMDTGKCLHLPGYRIIPVPCSGWVHPLMIERALRHGAQGVLVVGCGPDPMYRTGTLWTELRLIGERSPSLREAKIDKAKVRFMRYDRSSREEFLRAALEFRQEKEEEVSMEKKEKTSLPLQKRLKVLSLSTILLMLLLLPGWFFSEISYPVPIESTSEIVISFKLAGEYEKTKEIKKDDKDLLPHMRGAPGSQTGSGKRSRVPVRMRIYINGKKILEKSYPPRGLFQDGSSLAMENIPLSPGAYKVRVEIGDRADSGEWNHGEEKDVILKKWERKVLLFQKNKGFHWYE